MIEREIAEFGRRMGMPGFALNSQGVAALDVEGMGRLFLEQSEHELLVYLALPCPAYDHEAPRRILRLCHYKNAHPLPLTGGFFSNKYLLLTRLSERAVTAAAIENAAQFLAEIMGKAVQE